MSSSINQVNYDALTQIAKQLHSESEEHAQLNAQTRQRMDALQGGWQGDAAKAFFGEMNGTVLPASQRVVGALQAGESVLNQIMQIIHQADEETASYFKGQDAPPVPVPVPVPVPTPTPLPSQAKSSLPQNWDEITRVAQSEKGATPELIAAVLEYERTHRNPIDAIEDLEGKFIMLYEGKLEDIEVGLLNATLGRFGESFDKISFGPAQMNPDALTDLVNNGYITKPANWDTDRRDAILGILLDEKRAPELVAARLAQISDHWKVGGVDISNRPDALGNLYSIGLEGKQGVHPDVSDYQEDRGEEIEKMVLDLLNRQKAM